MTPRLAPRYGAMLSVGIILAPLAGSSASAIAATGTRDAVRLAPAAARRASPRVSCIARNHKYDKLATRMAHDIDAKLTGRVSTIGLKEVDSKTGVVCAYHPTWHFYAASAIKAVVWSSVGMFGSAP